eukprot:COSAG01_NODE_964_length_12401_cov_4.078930_3_plen_97_part_00
MITGLTSSVRGSAFRKGRELERDKGRRNISSRARKHGPVSLPTDTIVGALAGILCVIVAVPGVHAAGIHCIMAAAAAAAAASDSTRALGIQTHTPR